MKIKHILAINFTTILAGYLLFILYSVYSHNPYSVPFRKTKMFEASNAQYIADNQLGYKPRTNFSGYSDIQAYTEIHYDHLGARVNSPLHKTPDTVDMITVGCSQAWGQGVENKDTFTQKVSELNGMKVANFGVSSYGGTESFLRMKQHLNLKPKYVVYAFWEDHFNRNLSVCNQTFPVCLERPVLKRHVSSEDFSIVFPHFSKTTFKINQRWFKELADFNNDGKYSITKASFWAAIKPLEVLHMFANKKRGFAEIPNESEKIPAVKYILKEMKSAANAAGAELIVIFMPYYFDTVSSVPHELEAFIEKEKIHLISLSGDFQALLNNGNTIAIPGDGHINKETHHLIAKRIVEKISSLEKKDNG